MNDLVVTLSLPHVEGKGLLVYDLVVVRVIHYINTWIMGIIDYEVQLLQIG